MKTSSDSMIAITRKPVRPSKAPPNSTFPATKVRRAKVIPAASQSQKIERRQRRDRAVEDEGINVSVATVAFGKTCLKMIALLESRARGRR